MTEATGGAGLLGLFPSFDTLGGVQASGRVAWGGIARPQLSPFGRRYLICHGSATTAANGTVPDLIVSSRVGALAAALGRRWPTRLVLVWHMDLLKYLYVLRATRPRVVLFLHGIEAWRRPPAPLRMLLRRVHCFLTNSGHTWERFAALNGEMRAVAHRTVHLGIGEPVRHEVPRPAGTPAAVMISRLDSREDYKGHREVIAAWPCVAARVPQAELWIVGDGDLRRDLEMETRAAGLAGRVRFLGSLNEQAKEHVLTESRCLLMPSRGEGFGLVYLEAMRLGRPCLVSTLDAGSEVVNPPEAGLAVDPGDRGQVANAICRLLSAGAEWDRWSLCARQRYEQGFTAAHFEQRIIAALADVAGNESAA